MQLFFIISGFYMQFVLTSSYASTRQFYVSRALRIFVPYFATLLLVVVASAASAATGGGWLTLATMLGKGLQAGPAGSFIAIAANFTVIFQDWVMFLQHDPGGSLALTADVWKSSVPLWHYLAIPQAWSIGVELSFYLVAPFLALRMTSAALVTVIAASLSARFGCYFVLGAANDPWTYRFFPFELTHFLYGMLAARIYLGNSAALANLLLARIANGRLRALLAYVGFGIAVLAWIALATYMLGIARPVANALLPFGSEVALLAAYLPWIVVLPVVFALTRNSGLDRYLGEFSYPVYLIHYTVVLVLTPLVAANARAYWAAAVSLAISALLMHSLVAPFERWRKGRVAAIGAGLAVPTQ